MYRTDCLGSSQTEGHVETLLKEYAREGSEKRGTSTLLEEV